MSDDDLIIKVPPGPTPEACHRCGTTDEAALAWPEPWQNPVVMHGPDNKPVRFCWDCTTNHLVPLSVDYGEPEGDAVKVETELTFDREAPVNQQLFEWFAQQATNPQSSKPIVGFKGDTFLDAGMIVLREDDEDEAE